MSWDLEVAGLSDLVETKAVPARIGNKAANLFALRKLGLPVPPAVVLSTEIYRAWAGEKCQFSSPILERIRSEVAVLADECDRIVGDRDRPLLVSVRSGAQVSMPGLMSTLLNVGVSPEMVDGWRRLDGDRQRFWASVYWRMVHDFAGAAARARLEDIVRLPSAADRLSELAALAQEIEIPQDPVEQIITAIDRVLASWSSPGARSYRRQHGISEDLGTAVVIQRMVFGNADSRSATGLVTTRDPDSGEPILTGGYLMSAQGPDVVGAEGPAALTPIGELGARLPEAMAELERCARAVEDHFGWPQDLELTIESGRLWLLQARRAPLSPTAVIRVAVDLVDEGRLTAAEAVAEAPPTAAIDAKQRRFAEPAVAAAIDGGDLLATGLAAAPGLASGALTCDPERAGPETVLIADLLDPVEHFLAIETAAGLITRRGGTGSHTATLARLFGTPYVTGCGDLHIDDRGARFGDRRVEEGATISIEGDSGRVFRGELEQREQAPPPQLEVFAGWQADHLPASRWQLACYRERGHDPKDLVTQVRRVVAGAPWRTAKAVAVELVAAMIPEALRIPQFVFAASDADGLRRCMLDGLAEGRWIGLRPCYSVRSFGRGTWQMALSSPEQVAGFFAERDFVGPVKRGGYPAWIEDPSLTEIIAVWDPPHKGMPELADRQFAFSISSAGTRVAVELVLGTVQVRYLEVAEADALIHLAMDLDHRAPLARGPVRARFGDHYVEGGAGPVDTTLGPELADDRRIRPIAAAVARAVGERVFGHWWAPPVELPHRMCALDSEYGLFSLEFQGQFSGAGEIDYVELFDVKGAEEKGFVTQRGASRS